MARRIGADPARAVLEPIGGQGPQHLVTEFAGVIASGGADVVMIFGSENTSTLRYFADRDDKPDYAETAGGQLEDRGYGYEGLFDDYIVAHGLVGAPAQYGLLEKARRGRLGLSVDEYRLRMGELFAPFPKVAAKNPFSASPVERTVDEIITVTDANRMICDPYPRLLVAHDQVHQGAAAVLMSVDAADGSGCPRRSGSPCAGTRNFCDGMGVVTDDPRGLTLTGGLPYFGAPGNDYSLHGIAETVNEMRDKPGQFGLVAANGGIVSKYSVGVSSTEAAEWRPDRSSALRAEVAARPKVAGDSEGRRAGHHRDPHGALRLARAHRTHRRPAGRRRQPLPGPDH